jgi:acyl-CoA thioesterase FadM
MLVRAEIDWQGSCTYGEVLTVTAGVEHWGTTSFRVRYGGGVGDRPVFACLITYVCVAPGTTAKMPIPDFLKDVLATIPA